eukprot:6213645-Pleurochrysis_carterae.AAC.1
MARDAPLSPPSGPPSLLRIPNLACFPPSQARPPLSNKRSTRTRCGAGTWSPRSSWRSSAASRTTLDISSIGWPWRASRASSPTRWLPFWAPPFSLLSTRSPTQSISITLHSAVARQIAVYAD